VKKEKANTRKWKIVLFLFRVIPAYLNTFVESFKNVLETAKASRGIPFSSLVTFFILPSAFWNLFFWGQFSLQEREKSIKKTGIVLTSVDEALAWRKSPLLLPGRTLRRSAPSVNLHGAFDESSPYWRLIHPTSFWEPIDGLVSPFHGHLRLCLHFERLKDARFWEHSEDPNARL
jgi:hypothetical protein